MRRILFLLLFTSLVTAQTKRPITIDDLWKMERINSFELSGDGKLITFASTKYDMDANKGNSDIYLMNADGSNLKAIVKSGKNESSPKFSPDGKKIAYLFDDQIYLADLNGENAVAVTSLSTGVNDFTWSPDGKKMLFTSSVYPDCKTDAENKARDEEKEKSKVKASIFTELMFRHWNEWRGEKRSHLFLLDLATKEYIDVMPGSQSDCPPIALGSEHDYSFSPDSKEIAFTMNPDKVVAISTNNEIYLVSVADVKKGEKPAAKRISESKGNDNQPVYSPDGKYIAFCSMERAGFEADKQRVALYERATGQLVYLTAAFDRSAAELVWSPDAKSIYFNASNEIHETIYRLDIATKNIDVVYKEHDNSGLRLSPDGKTLFVKQQRSELPTELLALDVKTGAEKQLTRVNAALVSQLALTPAETFWSDGAEGAKVQSILIKPPFFDPQKKYPMIFLVHGGPQGHWNDEFHYRWNTQMFASRGYVVVAVNPRGSTGYGQKFTDEISGDWGGKVYTDLMNACDYALKTYPFIDTTEVFAAGASYGGYMMNWIMGHTNRFKAIVSHDGVFNLESMFGVTEELWFAIWENKGKPWENRELYEKYSPHRFIQNCKTPVLVVEGAKDFRVPEDQAFQLFTSLQLLGVESNLLYFPDEFHFVTKPQNARLWWNTVLGWFDKHK